MALIKWRESYSVGIDQFDEEHKFILKLINELFQIVKEKDVAISVTYEIEQLIDYTKKHFTNEERAMEEVGYELLEKHKATHEELVQKVIVFKKRIENGDESVNSEFYLFLREWLLSHILEEDMKYGAVLSNSAPERA